LTPRLAESPDPARRLRAVHRLCANAVVEIALGVAILLIVAWLGITMPGAPAPHIH
jgi:putative copper export protein